MCFGNVGNIYRHLIHADPADDRGFFAVDENISLIGQIAWIAVCIADGKYGDPFRM